MKKDLVKLVVAGLVAGLCVSGCTGNQGGGNQGSSCKNKSGCKNKKDSGCGCESKNDSVQQAKRDQLSEELVDSEVEVDAEDSQ